MAVDPRGADLKRYLQEDPGGPVVMLNLLRYAEGGRELYAQYARALSDTFLPRYGGEVLYAGDGSTPLVADSGQEWDAVLLVRYPSRAGVQPHGRGPRVPGGHRTPDPGAHRGRTAGDRPLVTGQPMRGSTWILGPEPASPGRSPASTAATCSSPTVAATSGRGSTAPLA